MVPAAVAFNDTSRQQDGQEWVMCLIEAIEKELPLGRKQEWMGLFEIGISGTYECTAGHLKVRMPEVLSMLQLGIISQVTGRPLITMVQAMENYFSEEVLEKNCAEEGCGAVQATSSNHITFHPQLLILHYKRFLGPGIGPDADAGPRKVKHPVSGLADLNMNGIKYGLVGLVVHLGEHMATGHYMAVTR